MTILIIALVAVLVSLSRKYILRLEPAGVFAAMWAISIPLVLMLQHYIALQFYGILFILGGVIMLILGTIFCDSVYHPAGNNIKLTIRKERILPVMLLLLIGAMVNPLYSIILHGFNLNALLSMQDILNMNKQISEDRYSTGGITNMANQFFLIFCYAAPLFGGFCYRWCGRLTKTICILTLVPGIFIALTQSMKMGMITGFILWFTGYLVCAYSYDIPIRLKAKHLLRFMGGFAVFFGILFSSMVLRTGEISERAIMDISQKFITYAFGQFHCFDTWFTFHETSEYALGGKTFLGITNLIGLEERIQGVYQEYHQIGQNGYYGIANIFTIFRSLIEDFGESGAYFVLLLLGAFSKYSFKNLICGKSIILNQVIITAVYAYLLWSFATSFFAYTSYIAMFAVALFLFIFLQKETTE